MNCPACDSQILTEQKFCRFCGASLQMITQPLAEQAALSNPQRIPAITSLSEPPQTNKLALWGFIIMFIGAAIGVIGKKLIHEDVVTVVGVLISLAGMSLAVYPYLSPPRPEKSSSLPSTQSEALIQPQTLKYLPQERNTEYTPSVTERTTDLLKASAVVRPRQKED